MEYSSNAKGNLATTLGAIGTGLGVINSSNAGTGLLGLGGIGGNANSSYVTKEMMDLQFKLVDSEKNNAILSADLSSEKKMVEVFNATNEKINAVRDELSMKISAVNEKVDANAASQGVINAQYGSQINLNTSQINQLFSLCKLVIPNGNVCPGWGQVTIMPSGGTTVGTTIS